MLMVGVSQDLFPDVMTQEKKNQKTRIIVKSIRFASLGPEILFCRYNMSPPKRNDRTVFNTSVQT